MTHVIGIDPGLIHTGVVSMKFWPDRKAMTVRDIAVFGIDTPNVKQAADTLISIGQKQKPSIYIEAYRPRSNLNSDQRMVVGVKQIHDALPGSRVLQNTGVKQVISEHLMRLLGVWKFETTTNHQDLRSAARIALLGMVKDEEHNLLLSNVVRDHLEGRTWDVKR